MFQPLFSASYSYDDDKGGQHDPHLKIIGGHEILEGHTIQMLQNKRLKDALFTLHAHREEREISASSLPSPQHTHTHTQKVFSVATIFVPVSFK